jgi:hypothetical protein
MQSIRSGAPSASAISELKVLLDLVSDPAKVKAALKDLDEKLKEAGSVDKALGEKAEAIAKAESAHLGAIAKVNELTKLLEAKEAALKGKEAAINMHAAEVHAKEKALASQAADFEAYSKEKGAELITKLNAADAKFLAASTLEKKSELLVKEFEEKSKKLKAAMG